MLIYSIYGNIVNARPLKKEINYTYAEQLKDLSVPFFMSAIMSIVVLMILKLHMNDVITLIMQVLVGAVLYIGMSMSFKIDSFLYLQKFVIEKTRR